MCFDEVFSCPHQDPGHPAASTSEWMSSPTITAAAASALSAVSTVAKKRIRGLAGHLGLYIGCLL